LAFVGNNAKKMFAKSGKFEGWESSDGLKRFRPPTFKKGQNKIQSNFEQRTSTDVQWGDIDEVKAPRGRSNLHVDTDKSFDFKKENK
jgi:hypothetical protein